MHPQTFSSFCHEIQLIKMGMGSETMKALHALPGVSKSSISKSFLKQAPKASQAIRPMPKASLGGRAGFLSAPARGGATAPQMHFSHGGDVLSSAPVG